MRTKSRLHMSNYFLYIGNAYPHKNLARLIKAVVILNMGLKDKVILKMTNARSVFVERLKRLITELKAEEYVELLGYVADKDLPNLYKNSIAFVFPSLSEGFGLPGLEAMQAGALVLASDIPVFREVYKNNVAYFDPLSVESIAETMKKALDLAPDRKAEIIKNAKDFAKRYSWAKMAKETLKIYEEAGRNSLRQGK